MSLKPENEMLVICTIAAIVIILSSFLGGCATQPLQVTAPCPKPDIPAEPHYPAQDLKKGDSHSKVAKAYVASLSMCLVDADAVRHICEGYK